MSKPIYTLTMLKEHLDKVLEAQRKTTAEIAAFLYCQISKSSLETRFLVSSIEIVESTDLIAQSDVFLGIESNVYKKALRKAEERDCKLIMLHTHPGGYPAYSHTDDVGEKDLFEAAYNRGNAGPHGSLLVIGMETPNIIGRAWEENLKPIAFKKIRVLGTKLQIFETLENTIFDPGALTWTDRQVRAFGPEVQALIEGLVVGLVGAGGTGSALAQQLIRLGVKNIIAIDHDILTTTNLNRVYGSLNTQVISETSKVDIIKQEADRIGLGCEVQAIKGSICQPEIALKLRDCDIVFGATDDQLGRLILNRLSIWYYIPVIDMGFGASIHEGFLQDVLGRITILKPGSACLNCRGRIDQNKMRSERLINADPEQYEKQVQEGYIPELGTPNPAVVPFTTAIAAQAMMEFLQLITGYMGEHRETTEILLRFADTEIIKTSRKGKEGCYCLNPEKWGKGDQTNFLGLSW